MEVEHGPFPNLLRVDNQPKLHKAALPGRSPLSLPEPSKVGL